MNFYLRLRDLDHRLAGDSQCAIPTGRAYVGANGPYADKIHVIPFAEKLQNLPSAEPRLYMGTAGLMNFGHLRDIKPDYAILFDVNPFQIVFWNVVLSALRHNDTMEGFRQVLNYAEVISRRIISRKLGHIEFSSAGSWTEVLNQDDGVSLSRKAFTSSAASFSSYLDSISFSQEDYAFIKSMAEQGRIGTLTLDVFDPKAWEQLSAHLKELHAEDASVPLKADSLYLSSVLRFADNHSDWTGRTLKDLSMEGLSAILDPSAGMVIDHRGHYTADHFYNQTNKEKPWLLQPRTLSSRVSAPASGAGPLVPLFT